MTTLMKTLIERLREIPEDEQDKYAAAYLKELDEDQRWADLFEQTTEEQWEALVEEARQDVEATFGEALEAINSYYESVSDDQFAEDVQNSFNDKESD